MEAGSYSERCEWLGLWGEARRRGMIQAGVGGDAGFNQGWSCLFICQLFTHPCRECKTTPGPPPVCKPNTLQVSADISPLLSSQDNSLLLLTTFSFAGEDTEAGSAAHIHRGINRDIPKLEYKTSTKENQEMHDTVEVLLDPPNTCVFVLVSMSHHLQILSNSLLRNLMLY